nr:polysaccharide biosynthesis/export family protein [Paraburkholderia antibiotica]
MRMSTNTGAQSSTTSGAATTEQENSPIPITDINVALIRQMRDTAAKANENEALGLAWRPAPYTIGIGDVLQITVWDHPELAAALGTQPQSVARASDPVAGFVVDQQGNLTFPYVGNLHVEGLRTDQVQQQITQKLDHVFNGPQVTVRIASFRSQQIYIDGEVHTPGAQQINDIPMTLYEAINRAGGFSTTADQSRLTLVRGGVSYPIDLQKMIASGQNPSKIVLKNGDVLRVLARDDSGVYVMGEVNRPAIAVPMKNGRLSLSDAIAQAGSLNNASADAAQLYVIRGSLNANPQVFHLDAKSPVSMILANQFDLQPEDIVYIDGNGLVRFSRVLSLLMPAINAGLTAAIVTK